MLGRIPAAGAELLHLVELVALDHAAGRRRAAGQGRQVGELLHLVELHQAELLQGLQRAELPPLVLRLVDAASSWWPSSCWPVPPGG
ncbi:MAG: hypothetical protein V4795_00530 [Pseudomonadota bacterium]